MVRVRRKIKFIKWVDSEKDSIISGRNGTFYLDIDYFEPKNEIHDWANHLRFKRKFTDHFYNIYGIELVKNDITLFSDQQKPSTSFKIKEIYIHENDADRLMLQIRKLKINQIINASYK